jgi:hypothetical protein
MSARCRCAAFKINSQSKAFGLDLYIGVLTSPIPMIPITGWLPEPVDWVTVVAMFAATFPGVCGVESLFNEIIQLEGKICVSWWVCSWT